MDYGGGPAVGNAMICDGNVDDQLRPARPLIMYDPDRNPNISQVPFDPDQGTTHPLPTVTPRSPILVYDPDSNGQGPIFGHPVDPDATAPTQPYPLPGYPILKYDPDSNGQGPISKLPLDPDTPYLPGPVMPGPPLPDLLPDPYEDNGPYGLPIGPDDVLPVYPVSLRVPPDRLALMALHGTFNQSGAARGAEELIADADGALVVGELQNLGEENAFDAIGGEVHSEAAAVSKGSSDQFMQLLMRMQRGDNTAGVVSAQLGGPNANAGYGADLMADPAEAPKIWFGGFGGYSDVDGDGNASGYEDRTFGMVGGLEAQFGTGDAFGGISAGYSHSALDLNSDVQNADIQSIHAGLYARSGARDFQAGWSALAAFSYSHHFIETDRDVVFGGINRTAEAEYDGFTAAVDAELRYNHELGTNMDGVDHAFMSPFVRMNLSNTDLGSYQETGAAALSLSGNGDNYGRATGSLGVEFASLHSVNGTVWRPSVSLAYEYSGGDEAETVNTFTGSPTSFITRGVEETNSRFRIGTNFEAVISDQALLTFATDTVISEDRLGISANAGLKFEF